MSHLPKLRLVQVQLTKFRPEPRRRATESDFRTLSTTLLTLGCKLIDRTPASNRLASDSRHAFGNQ